MFGNKPSPSLVPSVAADAAPVFVSDVGVRDTADDDDDSVAVFDIDVSASPFISLAPFVRDTSEPDTSVRDTSVRDTSGAFALESASACGCASVCACVCVCVCVWAKNDRLWVYGNNMGVENTGQESSHAGSVSATFV